MRVICYDGNDTIFHLIDQNLLQGRRNLGGRAIPSPPLQNLFPKKILYYWLWLLLGL